MKKNPQAELSPSCGSALQMKFTIHAFTLLGYDLLCTAFGLYLSHTDGTDFSASPNAAFGLYCVTQKSRKSLKYGSRYIFACFRNNVSNFTIIC